MALFDQVAATYDGWFGTPHGRIAWDLERRLLLEFLQPHPGEEILDAGCGTGILTQELAERGVNVTGIDLSSGMLAIAREKLRHFENVVLARADVAALPLPTSSFDAVVCFTVLEFVCQPAEALREMWRVLKPGGRLVVGVLNRLSSWAWSRSGRGIFTQAHFYSYWEFRSLLKKALGHVKFRFGGCVYFPPFLPVTLLPLASVLEFSRMPCCPSFWCCPPFSGGKNCLGGSLGLPTFGPAGLNFLGN